MLNDYRAGGLGVAGLDGTLDALTNGQVDELILGEGGLAAFAL